MPELPEVETVARDLRGLIVGATIADAATNWNRTLRNVSPEAFADGVAGRRIEAVGRRGKQLVVDLSGEAFLTIHLKMTGQLFVVPQGGPPDPYVRVVLELEDGREIRFRDIRKFGRIGLYGASTADPFAETGPEPVTVSTLLSTISIGFWRSGVLPRLPTKSESEMSVVLWPWMVMSFPFCSKSVSHSMSGRLLLIVSSSCTGTLWPLLSCWMRATRCCNCALC